MRLRFGTAIVAGAACVAFASTSHALAFSDFDDGTLQGWTLAGGIGGTLFHSTDGNPGGAMGALDSVPAVGIAAQAPEEFTGDLSIADGISWDEFVPDRGTDTVQATSILIEGTDGTTYRSDRTLGPLETWNRRMASFTAAEWTLETGAASFEAVLANVVALYIDMDTSMLQTPEGNLESLIDNVAIFAGAAPLDVQAIELFKGVDRIDGTPNGDNPWFFEACVAGESIQNVTVETPDGSKDTSEVDGEFCFSQVFASQNELDTAFPSAGEDYTFGITPLPGAGSFDSLTVAFDESAPPVYPDFTQPADGSEVPAEQDLTVGWELMPSAVCSGAACGDGIALFVVSQASNEDVSAETLGIEDTETVVAGAALTPSTSFDLELESFFGFEDPNAVTDNGDPTSLTVLYEDINAIAIATPEPSAGAAGIAALVALMGLARRQGSSGHRRRISGRAVGTDGAAH